MKISLLLLLNFWDARLKTISEVSFENPLEHREVLSGTQTYHKHKDARPISNVPVVRGICRPAVDVVVFSRDDGPDRKWKNGET